MLHAKQLQLHQLNHGITASTASDGLRMEPPTTGDCFCAGRCDGPSAPRVQLRPRMPRACSSVHACSRSPQRLLHHACRWDPHHAHSLGLAVERTILTVDTRTMKPAYTLADAHSQRVRGLDYNPNRPYVALSCGDDFAMKFWDLRKASVSAGRDRTQRERQQRLAAEAGSREVGS